MYALIPGSRDWIIKGDCAAPTIIRYLAEDYDAERDEKGFNIFGCEKWPGSIEHGIAYLKTFDNIFIHPRCVETGKEFRLYRRKVDKISGKVLPAIIIDDYNHIIDAVRYSIDDLIKDSISKDMKYDEADNIDTIVNKLNW
jgi:phage terminase large subunit